MAETLTGLGHTVVVEPGPLVVKPPRVRVAGEDAARIALAWALAPENEGSVPGVCKRLRLVTPFAASPDAVALDAAALADALRAGTLVAHAAAPVTLPPAPPPAPGADAELLAAVVVRDLTGTPLRGVELAGRWEDGSEERQRTGDTGVAVWRRRAAAKQLRLEVRQVDASAYTECVLEDSGWRARGAPAPRGLVCRPGRPEVTTVYLQLPHTLQTRFAWQRPSLRERFYPFRVLMLRRFLRLHRESELGEQLAKDPALRASALKALRASLHELNESLTCSSKETLRAHLEPLRGLVHRTPDKRYALNGEQLPQLVAFRANQWALDKGLWRAGHGELLQRVKEAWEERPAAYPPWVRYMTLHFPGMVYASAHGSLGRPDSLIRMLRLGGGKAVERASTQAKGAEPGHELRAELASATSAELVALAVESGAWTPAWLGRLGAAALAAGPLRDLRQAVAALTVADRLLPTGSLDATQLGVLRKGVEALWRAVIPAFIDRAGPEAWLAHLIERAPKWASVGHDLAPLPAAVWTPVVAYTPLRADFEVDIQVRYDPKNPTPAARFVHTFPPLPDGAWGTFLRAWLGLLQSAAENVDSVTQWSGYNTRTLEPIIRGVCNQNNEMSYRARGYFKTSGGGLRDNALRIFQSQGGTFLRLASADPEAVLDKVRVGSSLFYLGLSDDPIAPGDAWSVVDPAMRAITGGTPVERQVEGVGTVRMLLRQSNVKLSPSYQDREEPVPDVTARTWILRWTHEAVVLRVDPVLQRVLLHDTAVPTGVHAKSFDRLLGVYVGTPGGEVTRQAEVEALIDVGHLLRRSDDEPDPKLPEESFKDGMMAAVLERDGPEQR